MYNIAMDFEKIAFLCVEFEYSSQLDHHLSRFELKKRFSILFLLSIFRSFTDSLMNALLMRYLLFINTMCVNRIVAAYTQRFLGPHAIYTDRCFVRLIYK